MGKIKIKTKLSTVLFVLGIGVVAVGSNFVSIVDVKHSGGILVQGEYGPAGTIMMWGNENIPYNWIEVKGQTTKPYPKLSEIYGDNLPDLRGAFIRGWDHGRNIDIGRELLSFQYDDNKSHLHMIKDIDSSDLGTKTVNSGGSHSHTFPRPRGDENYYNGSSNDYWGYSNNGSVTTSTTGNHSHTIALGSHGHSGYTNLTGTEFRPKNVSMIYIIKTN